MELLQSLWNSQYKLAEMLTGVVPTEPAIFLSEIRLSSCMKFYVRREEENKENQNRSNDKTGLACHGNLRKYYINTCFT
jgi:hypothetical protein